MRNAAERSFWTLSDHPPDLGMGFRYGHQVRLNLEKNAFCGVEKTRTSGDALGEVVARPTVEPHPLAILAGDHAETAVLDLVQPQLAGRRARGWGGKARRPNRGRRGGRASLTWATPTPPRPSAADGEIEQPLVETKRAAANRRFVQKGDIAPLILFIALRRWIDVANDAGTSAIAIVVTLEICVLVACG
jgi:hypothetical protein